MCDTRHGQCCVDIRLSPAEMRSGALRPYYATIVVRGFRARELLSVLAGEILLTTTRKKLPEEHSQGMAASTFDDQLDILEGLEIIVEGSFTT